MKRLIVTLILAAALPLFARENDRYVVRLDPAAAAGRVDALAAQLAATHGGTVLSTESATEDTIVLQLSPSRVRALAADPRVRSVDPVDVAAQAVVEPVNWTAGVEYHYDGAGSVTRIGDDRFVYDAVGRLVQAKVNGVTRDYTYDAFGNRTGCSAPGTDCQYMTTISPGNNRINKTGTEYDDAGNVEKLGTHAYEYDAANMMKNDHSPDGKYEYLYDADDERLATYHVGSDTWTWTLRDQSGRVLREFTSNGSTWEWKRDYVHRDGGLLASRFPNATSVTTHHYHLDHLGSARRVTDDSDLIVGFHDYYAFGPEISGSLQEPNATDLKYTGHEREPGRDDQYQLDYMLARFYNPTLGRFLSRDPVLNIGAALAHPQLWNRYAYAGNSPMKYIDPDGRELTIATRRNRGVLEVNIRLTVEVRNRTGDPFTMAELKQNMQGAANILGGTFTAPGRTPIRVTTTIDMLMSKKGGTDKSRHQMEIDPKMMRWRGSQHETELGGNTMTMSYLDPKWLAHEIAHWMGLDNEYDQDAASDEAFPGMETNLMNNAGGTTDMTHGQWLEILRAYREGEVNKGIERKK